MSTQQYNSHEPNRWNNRAVLGTLAAFAASIFVTLCLMHGLLLLFEAGESKEMSDTIGVTDVISPAASLDVHQTKSLHHLRAEEEARLTSFGWINRDQSVAHIPIDRAMTLIAQRGMPDRVPGVDVDSTASETKGEGEP